MWKKNSLKKILSMINIYKSDIVFLQFGEELHSSIIGAFRDTCAWMREAYQLQDIDLTIVSTKTHPELALPAHVERFILKNAREVFDDNYVRDIFKFTNILPAECSYELYGRVIKNPNITGPGRGGFRKAYFEPLGRGFRVFLVALHIRRAIVLPFSFRWPRAYKKDRSGRIIQRRELIPLNALPGLLKLFRSLEYKEGAQQSDPVFEEYHPKQRERLVWLGQRLLIATGWLELGESNYNDMLALKNENDETTFTGYIDVGWVIIVDLFERKYGVLSPINGEGWRSVLMNSNPKSNFQDFEHALRTGHGNLIQLAAGKNPSSMTPEAISQIKFLPGLKFNLEEKSEIWIDLERKFLRKFKIENKKARTTALGHFNIYLFGYLAYWYADNPDFKFDFPSNPQKLVAGVFVSDIGLLNGQSRPMSFVEFFAVVASVREWGDANHYALLKQIEKFFRFIEQFSESLPYSSGFRQPLHKHDFPRPTGSSGTQKRPIPRVIFKLFLSYAEGLAELSRVLFERVQTGELSSEYLAKFRRAKTIDVREHQEQFGFVPIVWHQGKMFPQWDVANVFSFSERCLPNGILATVPHPHAIHQIIVSLYTGIRQNHIQWLDRNSFDRSGDTDDISQGYAELHVNTDKVKVGPWRAFVNLRVIEILRLQREWCNQVSEAAFADKIFYNNNPETKWGKILPLFAFSKNGKPHSDEIYSNCWMRLLVSLQYIVFPITGKNVELVRLLPKGIDYDDPDLNEKILEYGNSQSRKCAVIPKSDITPHSARVSVVSQAISILPADLIGRYFTGQTEATVYHYVVPDEEEVFAEQQRQHLHIRTIGYEQGYEAMLRAPSTTNTPYIKADDVNSNLSASLRMNPQETLKEYGCVSLSLSEHRKSGIDVLLETRGVGAVETKTEICPYGRQCPPEVVAELRGWRRCGPCGCAVRSVDHLPAITAQIRLVYEGLTEVESRLVGAEQADCPDDDLATLEESRNMLAEDLAAWQLNAEKLEVMRQRILSGASTKTWHVLKPEIVERDLKRVLFPSRSTEYVLARLKECEAFPSLEGPQIRARFDLFRRQLLAKTGNVREALSLEPSVNPRAECVGLLRSIVAAHDLSYEEVKNLLDSNSHLDAMPNRSLSMLSSELSTIEY